MAAEPAASDARWQRAPGYAWHWLQRSRPIVERLAWELTGAPPRPGFVHALRQAFAEDPLVRDVVLDVVAEVAFRGRVPAQRPPGVSWDRGLTWWAATLAGVEPSSFESGEPDVEQRRLFDPGTEQVPDEQAGRCRALVAALRALVAAADGDQIPVATVQQLIADFEAARNHD